MFPFSPIVRSLVKYPIFTWGAVGVSFYTLKLMSVKKIQNQKFLKDNEERAEELELTQAWG